MFMGYNDVIFQASSPILYAQVRVVDSVSKPIMIKNIGKYGISFNFKVKGASKGIFTVVPDVGTIDPGKDLTVQVCEPHLITM